jgi:hypothetical protein
LTGVLHYSFGAYEVHPTEEILFTRVNERPTDTPDIEGDLQVASFNVLNYFTTIDEGEDAWICGPNEDMECRGADTVDEFVRQRTKIINAIFLMDADVIGLMEIENHPTDAAVKDLVAGLNDVAGAGTYAYVDTGPIGDDAIKVAFIYKPASVSLAGSYAVLDSSVDPTFIDTKNRPALAQTFDEAGSGARFTAVVNHLKSKGSACNDVGDPDVGDGQGNCNLTRTSAAQAIANWLSTDPTNSGDPDYIIIGDLNAYALEDPITALKNAGYTDLIHLYEGTKAYSYVYYGQAGYLDHALSNNSLSSQIQDTTVWHINADEPSALDYNDYNQPGLYSTDPYRASDHDPVVVGMNPNAAPVCVEAYPTLEMLWPANHKFVPLEILGVTDGDGDAISITIDSIFQDEPVDDGGNGSTVPDAIIHEDGTFELRAERLGDDDGRVYQVTFTASDGFGGACSGVVMVGVPHDQGKKAVQPVDSGEDYDSTVIPDMEVETELNAEGELEATEEVQGDQTPEPTEELTAEPDAALTPEPAEPSNGNGKKDR